MKSSFSSPKTSTTRHRTSQSISTTTNPFTQDPLPKSSTSKSKILKTPDVLDTKNSERTRTSSSPQPHHALRDLSNLVGDSLLCSNLNSMGNTPDMSLTNAFNDPLPTPGGSHRKLLEEVNMLKKEVEQKNNMIDKLMKENLNLRKEMEEFLTTVDEAREYIDVELKECNNRIHELENEIQELRAENQVYKDQLSKKVNSSVNETSRENRSGANIFEEDVDGYYGQAKKEMEDFYFRLNEQIINFMEVSKKQYQDFNRIINNKVSQNNTTSNQITREETGAVLKTCPSSPKRDNSSSASAAKLTGPKPARTRNSSMSISYKNTSAKSPKSLRSPMTPKTPKTPKSMGLELKNNKTPKDNNNNMNNGEVSVNRSIDFRSLNQSSASRKRGSCMSMSRLEVEAGNGNANVGMVLNGDVTGQRNPTASHALSPKSSLLRAKLRSDMILQEMRRKIGEGLSNNVNGVY